MNIRQIMHCDCIWLDIYPVWEDEDEDNQPGLADVQRMVTRKMGEILYESGKVQNLNKLCIDLFNMEKRNSSAIGEEIAIPHVRCRQASTFVMGFARYSPGIKFNAPDDQNVRVFFPMIAPPHDDRRYLRFYKNFSKAVLESDMISELLDVEDPGEVIKVLNSHMRCRV